MNKMSKFCDTYWYSTFFVLILILHSCGDGDAHVESEKTKSLAPTRTQTVVSDSCFKNWLVDTLQTLKRSDDSVAFKSNVSYYRIETSADSSSLSISTVYDSIDGRSNARYPTDVLVILDLLKQYNEFPKNNFVLSFQANYFYSFWFPCELPYQLTVDFDSIMIKEQNSKVSSYGYIRGRLANKSIKWIDEAGHEKSQAVNFIWDDSTLRKVTLTD